MRTILDSVMGRGSELHEAREGLIATLGSIIAEAPAELGHKIIIYRGKSIRIHTYQDQLELLKGRLGGVVPWGEGLPPGRYRMLLGNEPMMRSASILHEAKAGRSTDFPPTWDLAWCVRPDYDTFNRWVQHAEQHPFLGYRAIMAVDSYRSCMRFFSKATVWFTNPDHRSCLDDGGYGETSHFDSPGHWFELEEWEYIKPGDYIWEEIEMWWEQVPNWMFNVRVDVLLASYCNYSHVIRRNG